MQKKITDSSSNTIKAICFDFDGVIHSFVTPWQKAAIISDHPIHGCREILFQLATQQKYKIIIHSVRCRNKAGREAIAEYMNKHNLYFDEIAEHKPVAEFYIDDRAINFSGNWQDVLWRIKSEGACHPPAPLPAETVNRLNELFTDELTVATG